MYVKSIEIISIVVEGEVKTFVSELAQLVAVLATTNFFKIFEKRY